MNTNTEHSINICNRLLRGEIAAVETYGQAIEKFADEPQVDVLKRIHTEHESSVALLTGKVSQLDGEPDESSGAWGAFAKSVQGAANFFGEGSAVASLKQGEEFGHAEYLDVLGDPEAPETVSDLVRDQLLPHTVEHIRTLEALEELLASS